MEESWRSDLLEKLKRRNRTEVLPFQNLFEMQNKLLEHNINLKTENSSLNFITEKLKEENLHLKSKATSENISQNNENFLELQKKLFKVQEELTELHRYQLNHFCHSPIQPQTIYKVILNGCDKIVNEPSYPH